MITRAKNTQGVPTAQAPSHFDPHTTLSLRLIRSIYLVVALLVLVFVFVLLFFPLSFRFTSHENDLPVKISLRTMQLLIFSTLVCSTATAGIFPPDPTELELPDLSDLQTSPSLSTTVPDSNLIDNGLPTSQFDSTNDVLTLPDFSGQDNDRTSFNLIDPDKPSSISIASGDLGKPDVQTFGSETNDEVPLSTTPNPNSDEISSTDPLLVDSIALTSSKVSGNRCGSGKIASTTGVETSQQCIDLSLFLQYKTDSTTSDKEKYSNEEMKHNRELFDQDAQWESRMEDEGFAPEWNEDRDHRCDHVDNRWFPFCCMGPYVWEDYGAKVKPRRNEKRFKQKTLNAGNCILFLLGRPRCQAFHTRFCCAKYGARMRWGWWGRNCVLMDP